MEKKTKIIYIVPVLIISILVSIDQITKYLITKNFALGQSKPIIKNIFELNYVQNEGAAWGMLSGKQVLFFVLTLIVISVCAYIYGRTYKLKKYKLLRITLIVLVAGALGNMIDRVKNGYVVDFFYFKPIDFPVFNVADIYVVISMIALFVLIIFVYSNDEIDEILGTKNKEKEQD